MVYYSARDRFHLGAVIPTKQLQDSPVHTVMIQSPFYIGITEVSQRQYTEMMGANPSRNIQTAAGDGEHGSRVGDLPVEHVTRLRT
jgi:formylglycine-generating enzyme required for sulfatase activity